MLALLLFNWIFCTPIADQNLTALSYQINAPGQTLLMPKNLEEISGISLSEDGKFFAAIQDEDGILFWLDKNTGKVEREVPFWDKGDYEDVALIGKTAYVVKSSGTIYEIPENGKDIKKYNFENLNSKNDVEGLAYDAKNNRLLLACKNDAGSENSNARAIYAFDLKNNTLNEKPAFLIKSEAVQEFLKPLPNTSAKVDLQETFQSGDMQFAPSAIAIHPQTQDLYLLSAIGNVLLVLDANGQVKHAEKLKKKIHAQPEGICFDKNGTMYISNEGNGDEPGKIYVFPSK